MKRSATMALVALLALSGCVVAEHNWAYAILRAGDSGSMMILSRRATYQMKFDNALFLFQGRPLAFLAKYATTNVVWPNPTPDVADNEIAHLLYEGAWNNDLAHLGTLLLDNSSGCFVIHNLGTPHPVWAFTPESDPDCFGGREFTVIPQNGNEW
jgi:hypothetical protein